MPCIAYPTLPSLPQDVALLHERLNQKTKEPQGELATTLIQNAASELINIFFAELLNELVAADESEPSYREARSMVREINEKLAHYLGWSSSFFNNDRIRPAVAHYHSMIYALPEISGQRAYIAFACSSALAQRIDAQLADLQQSQASSSHEAIETLIEIIDAAMHELLITPKKLMKFNFVVDKTLSGVISLTQTVAFRSLRKLAEHVPAEHQPIIAAHLQRLVRVEAVAHAA
ncbi:MAG: hypothetical protein ABIR53_04075 [Paraperlucidibaca sp.]